MSNTMKVIKSTVVNTSRLFKKFIPFAPRNQREKTEYKIILVHKFLKKGKGKRKKKSNSAFFWNIFMSEIVWHSYIIYTALGKQTDTFSNS